MTRLALALAAALAATLAACSPKPETTPVAATSPDAPPPGAAAKRLPLPSCTEVKAIDNADGWEHPDCRLHSSDKAGLSFEARYTKPSATEKMTVTIQVVAPGDATVQSFPVPMYNTFNAPFLQDIDGDGRDELLVPTETGNVNTTWSVWRAKGAETQYSHLEDLSGVEIVTTPSGFIATPARSSASAWSVAFYRFDGDDLEPVVTAEVEAQGDANKITSVDCKVADQGGLADIKLDAAAAKAKFCAEPVVTSIFK